MLTLGQIIKNARKKKGIGLREMARQLGTTPSYVTKVENGEIKRPSDDKLNEIFKIIGIDENYLADLDNTANNNIDLSNLKNVFNDLDKGKVLKENIIEELETLDSDQLEALNLILFKYRDIMLSIYNIEKSGERIPMQMFREMGHFFKVKYVDKNL